MELELEADRLVNGEARADSFVYKGIRSGPVEVIDTPGAGRRQFVSVNGLAEVVDNFDGTGGYLNTEVRTHKGAGTKSGGFYPGVDLIRTVRFQRSALPGGGDELTVEQIDADGTETTVFENPSATGDWSLLTDADQRKESRIESVNGALRTVVREVRSGTNELLEKIQETFTTFAWGEELTQEINDPDGEALTTIWTYETNSAANGYGLVTSMVDGDGYWERYTYYADGRREKTISQYLAAAVGAAESASRVRTTLTNGEDRTEIESVLGQEVSRRYVIRTTVGATTTERDEVCTVPGAAAGDPGNLVTTTVYRRDGKDVTRPDGTLVKTTIAPGTGGGETTTIEEGAASGGAVTDGTRTVVVSDGRGNELQRSVTDIASSTAILDDVATATDRFGRPTAISHLNGTTEGKTYGCCGIETWTDIEGIETVYGYDAFGNVDSETRAGITIGRTYDALGRLRLQTRTGTDNVPITIGGSNYTVAGRETLRHTILGDIGITDLPTGSNTWTRTETLPENATRITKRTSDGLVLEVSGTAEYPRTFDYEVASGLRSVKETRVGEGGATSEWIRRTVDAAGRSVTTAYPDNAEAVSGYNSLGQLVSVVDPDGVVTLLGYNARGEQESVTLDINRNGTTDADEPSATTTRSVVAGKLQTKVTESSNSGPITASVVDQSVDSLNRSASAYGQRSSVAVALSAATQTRTETTTLPDLSTVTRTFVDGRLASEPHAGGGKVARSVSYQYDGRGRLWKINDARTGTTELTYYETDLLHTVGKGNRTSSYDYNDLGQRTDELLPGNRTVVRGYRPTGEVTSVSGTAEYPLTYDYDPQGRLETMTTSAGTTTWEYHPQRGWLDHKKDATQKPVDYTYTAAARTRTRQWARGVTTTYGYDDGGRLETIDYSDDTPDVVLGYDARSQIDSVTDAAGSHTIGYSVTGAFASDTITAGLLDGVSVANGFDPLLRKSGFSAQVGTNTITSYGWQYDELSRLETITAGTDTADYTYHPNSALLHTLTTKRSGTTRLTTTRGFDNFDRLESNIAVPSGGGSVGTTYLYDAAGNRERATLPDATYWSYDPNDRGEVEGGTKKLANDTALSGYAFGYQFDGIGNRTSTTRNTHTATYTPTALNQYTDRTVPGFLDVLGKALPAATVTVNGQPTTRQGDGFFHGELTANNSASAVWQATTVTATDGVDQAEISGHLFLPATPEPFDYDDDGNLLSDGRWFYTWDGENRLESMVTRAEVAAVGAPRQRITFTYDYIGRTDQQKGRRLARRRVSRAVHAAVRV